MPPTCSTPSILRLLAQKLAKLSGLDRVFFSNSGTEAWEGALKIARAVASGKGLKKRTKILALENSFHGRTMGSLATTHTEKYRKPFAPVMPGVTFVKFNDVEDLKQKFDDNVCAVCIETIQGEGGIHPVSRRVPEDRSRTDAEERRAACCSMRFNAVWGARARCSPSSITASSRTW